MLQARARLIKTVHQFFDSRQVLQVDTPALSQFGNTDPNIDSFALTVDGSVHYLHTSPEYPMKRLIAGGSGDIYQICKVFRSNEIGRYHNAEFTLLEWYRVGFDYFELMSEFLELMQLINSQFAFYQSSQQISYRELFLKYTDIDPIANNTIQLRQHITRLKLFSEQTLSEMDHSMLCDCIMSHILQPKMAQQSLIFVYDYPASQCSLAKLNDDGKTARRFEVFVSGVELANGFDELTNATEQKVRFQNDQNVRQMNNQVKHQIDQHLLQALNRGLPDCSGVALGLDRLLMLLVSANHIKDVISFPIDIA